MTFVLLVFCDDLDDPKQPMRCGLLRISTCPRFSNTNEAAEGRAQSGSLSSAWFGYCSTNVFTGVTNTSTTDDTSATNDASASGTHGFDLRNDIGKPAYEAVWLTRARCNSTTSRKLIKPTGLVGHVYNIGSDRKTAYLKLTEEFINSEKFSRGRWSTEF